MTRCRLLALALGSSLCVAGCFGGSPPPRFYRPLRPVAEPARDQGRETLPVRLHTVTGDGFLGDRVVWAEGDVEVGLYEEERWTEPPATYARQALGRELYERRGLVRGGRAADLVLEVEVRRFEERLGPEHLVQVELWVLLTDRDGLALVERTVAVERPVAEGAADAMARAMGEALGDAVEQVGEAVQRASGEAAAAAGREGK
jgi:ABC-type uncharacterized transport system auxiliary subunit